MDSLFQVTAHNVKPGHQIRSRSVPLSVLESWRTDGLVFFRDDLPNWVTLTKKGYNYLHGDT